MCTERSNEDGHWNAKPQMVTENLLLVSICNEWMNVQEHSYPDPTCHSVAVDAVMSTEPGSLVAYKTAKRPEL